MSAIGTITRTLLPHRAIIGYNNRTGLITTFLAALDMVMVIRDRAHK